MPMCLVFPTRSSTFVWHSIFTCALLNSISHKLSIIFSPKNDRVIAKLNFTALLRRKNKAHYPSSAYTEWATTVEEARTLVWWECVGSTHSCKSLECFSWLLSPHKNRNRGIDCTYYTLPYSKQSILVPGFREEKQLLKKKKKSHVYK